MNIFTWALLLQADEGGGGGGYSQFLIIGLMVVVFYLFFIRPQRKRQGNSRKFLGTIKKGDHVVTVGGIHGKVSSDDNETFMIEVDKGCKLKVERSSLSFELSDKHSKAAETRS